MKPGGAINDAERTALSATNETQLKVNKEGTSESIQRVEKPTVNQMVPALDLENGQNGRDENHHNELISDDTRIDSGALPMV